MWYFWAIFQWNHVKNWLLILTPSKVHLSFVTIHFKKPSQEHLTPATLALELAHPQHVKRNWQPGPFKCELLHTMVEGRNWHAKPPWNMGCRWICLLYSIFGIEDWGCSLDNTRWKGGRRSSHKLKLQILALLTHLLNGQLKENEGYFAQWPWRPLTSSSYI